MPVWVARSTIERITEAGGSRRQRDGDRFDRQQLADRYLRLILGGGRPIQNPFDLEQFLFVGQSDPPFHPVVDLGPTETPLAADLSGGQFATVRQPADLLWGQVEMGSQRLDIEVATRHFLSSTL